MGDHYTPQYYLKGFVEPFKNELCVYEKGIGFKFKTQIKNIGNITKLYSTEFEQYLANTIEGPANIILDNIRKRNKISENDKKILSEYITVMCKRVPRERERIKKTAPIFAQKKLEEFDRELNIIASQEPSKADRIKRRKTKIHDIINRYAEDFSDEIWMDIIPPESTPKTVATIRAMTWTFLTFDEKPAFLTCDNPVFYFPDIGIGNTYSEITFPISSNITLWATWRSDLKQDYIQTTTQAVQEINRRTASNASKYVFHCRKEHWIEPFIKKGRWQLNRLL